MPLRCPRPRNLRSSHLPRQRGLCRHDELRAPRGMSPREGRLLGRCHHPERVSLQGQEAGSGRAGDAGAGVGEVAPGAQGCRRPAASRGRRGIPSRSLDWDAALPTPRRRRLTSDPERASLGAKPGRRCSLPRRLGASAPTGPPPHLPPRMQRPAESGLRAGAGLRRQSPGGWRILAAPFSSHPLRWSWLLLSPGDRPGLGLRFVAP